MTHRTKEWLIAAVALLAAAMSATAQTAVAPEPAPAAQRAVPADKIGPPLHAKEAPTAQIKHAETTGAAPKELKPSHGDAATPENLEKDPPSR